MRRLVLAWVLGVAGLSALGAVRAGALPLAGMSAVGPTASDGERALAASAESPTLPSFILKSFPSAQDLAQEVGDRWVPSGRPGGEPLVTLERWPAAPLHS